MRIYALIAGAALAAAPFEAVRAQSDSVSALGRSPTDTVYGIMYGLDEFARSIRRAELDIRSYRSPELEAALSTLATAARERRLRIAHASIGPLADFAFDSIEVDRVAKGKETVIVRARALMASDRAGARRVVIHFRQLAGRWVPVHLEGFIEYLAAQSRRYATREAQ